MSDGHTWEISIRERGSYSVAGEPGHHDSADWSELRTQTVRAWSLAAALDAARALPITAWFDGEDPAPTADLEAQGEMADELHVRRDDMLEQNQRLRAELEQLRELVAHVEAEAATTERERDTARAELEQLRAERDGLVEALREMRKAHAELFREVERLRAEQHEVTCPSCDATIRARLADQADRAELEQLRRAIEDDSELDRLTEENARLRARLGEEGS